MRRGLLATLFLASLVVLVVQHWPAQPSVTWTKMPLPVLEATEPWEMSAVFEPTVLYEDGRYRMWYTGGWSTVGTGYAESADGRNWVKSPANPLIRGAARNTVVRSGDTLYMFFSDGIGIGPDALHVATSRDGIAWDAAAGPVLEPGLWDRELANSFVWIEGNVWHMLYEARGPDGRWRMGLAEASDPFHWRKAGGPITDLDQPRYGQGGPWLQRLPDGSYDLWFHAGFPTAIHRATSTNLSSWRIESVPLLGRTLAFEVDQVADPWLLNVGNQTLLYYDGDDNTNPDAGRAAIGLAIADRLP